MAKLTLKTLEARINTLEARVSALEKGGKGSAPKTTSEKSATFMKYNPETGKRDIEVKCTPAQKAVWEKRSASYKEFDKEAWEQKRASYKPSKELKDAIKKNRAAVTHKVAKEMGFVGTKKDLAELKAQICK